jgi:hypothetical protein
MRSSALFVTTVALLSGALAGCGSGPETASGPGGTGGSTTSTGGSAGSGGAGGSTGGTGGDTTSTGGGGTGGTGTACSPGETQSCYDGPAGTEGVGLCKAGTRTCKANGEGFGPCQGEVTPVDETCLTLGDDDCDGKVNDKGAGCNCTPGTMMTCYDGPSGTLGVGLCHGGTQTCKLDGTGYGPCDGEVVPQTETCLTPDDDDCDGMINEDGPGCACVPGTAMPCYDGPAGTLGVGICTGGMAFCNASGTGIGPCTGEVLPQQETCLTPDDDDCDGTANEDGPGCVCVPNTMVPCYSGPAGTEGVGLCKAGQAPCNALGTGIGACSGEVLPQPETCLTPGDDDCNGLVNESGPGCSCTPGATQPCYSGPPGTVGVGACKAGVQTCAPDGSGYGACVGEVLPGPEDCSTPANESCSAAPDCGAQLWAKRFGAAGDQQANAVARDAQDDVLLTGRFAGSFTMAGTMLTSAGGYDVFVAKLDPNGNALWAKRFGDAGIYQEGYDIAADALGNVYVTGYFEGSLDFGGTVLTSAGGTDAFLAKLDPSGAVLWAKRFGASGPQVGQSIGIDAQGNVALLANGFGTVDFGGGGLASAGSYDMFVARFDSAGNHLWSKRFGGANSDLGGGLSVDGAGNIVFTGKSDTAIDFGNGAPLPAAGGLDVLLVKLDPLGSLLWNKRFGDSANQFGVDVATLGQGDVFLTGGFESTVNLGGATLTAAGAVDLFVARLTGAGAHVYSKRFGAAGSNPSAPAIAAGATGDLYLVGQFDGALDFGGGTLTSAGGLDAFALRLDPTGAHAWSRRFGAAGNQYASGAATDSQGQLLLTGYFEQTIDFGGALTSAGGLDLFAARLAQ